jgi:hypothetical protein
MGSRLAPASIVILLAGCSVGQGRGQISGSYVDRQCMVDVPDYEMSPTFFSADIVEDRDDVDGMPRKRLTIRVQRGSYREGDSDGLLVFVPDANTIAGMLGAPIPITGDEDAPVQLTLYMNQTCDSGFPRDFWRIPGVLEAQSGTVIFDAIYAPDVDPTSTEITLRLESVAFLDRESPDPEERMAIMSGEISFFYQRGRPAQPFP